MSKVILEGFIVVPEADLKQIKEELPTHIELTRNEPGCMVFHVEQSATDVQRFAVYEEFDSEAAFEQHQARVAGSRWGSVTKDVQRHYTITKI
ncbi:MAG: antibiotic biosynthesis monooxygenase [Pseudomonas sp.]|uniref:putative quinol monooxygenase n=1 Tax=Pseudomonas sp. TaxID=306 RepID=UPI0039826737